MVRRYLGPTIGHIELQRLSAQQIQGVYAGMLSRGLSNTTVVQLHRIFKQALGHALRWELVARNAAESTTPPKIKRKQMEMWDVPTTESS